MKTIRYFIVVHIATITTTEETIQDAFLVFKMLGKWIKQSDTPIDKLHLQCKTFLCVHQCILLI